MSLRMDELAHHGVLGMKWYVRRYQKYPAGYHGEGQYVGPDVSYRKPSFKERRQIKKRNKLKTVIDNATIDAIANGDKRMLKALKPTMDQQQFDARMRELGKNGVRINALNGNTSGVRSFKKDVSKQEYKYYKNLSKFVKASNNLDPKVMQKRMRKINDADLAALSNRINLVPGMDRKISEMKKIRNSLPTKADNIANAIKEGTKIAVAAGASIAAVYTVMNNLDNISRLIDNRHIRQGAKLANSLIKSGDILKYEKARPKLTVEQASTVVSSLQDKYRPDIVKAAMAKDSKSLEKYASIMDKKMWEELAKARPFLGG